MSSRFILLLDCLFVMILCSCGGGGGNDEPLVSTEYLNVTSQLTMSTDGSQTGTLEIKANCSWTITGNPSWMTLSQNSGSNDATITITCKPNPSAVDERSAVISVSSASGKVRRSVTISQPASAETLTVNVSEIRFGTNAESKVLSIQSNADWHITGIEDWFTLSKTSGSGNSDITVTVQNNETETPHNATITIQGTNKSERVVIHQDARERLLGVTPTAIKAAAVGNTYQITLTGDATWTATTNTSWCTLDKYSGVGGAQVTVTVQDNTSTSSRVSTLTFSTQTNSYNCEVTQDAAELPDITNIAVTEQDKRSFTLQASFTSDFPVTECGICYSDKTDQPQITDTALQCEASNGSFTATVSDLKSGHTFYVRAYVKSIIGISYSQTLTIKTTGEVPGPDDNITPEV